MYAKADHAAAGSPAIEGTWCDDGRKEALEDDIESYELTEQPTWTGLD